MLANLRLLPRVYDALRKLRGAAQSFIVKKSRLLPSGWWRFGAPRGLYSELNLLRRGKVEGQVVVESQAIPPTRADSLVYRAGLGQAGHQPWPIFWTVHPEARLLGPTLILADESKRGAIESMYGPHAEGDPSFKEIILPSPTRLRGNWTSIVSLWCNHDTCFNYYHWLMDGLPRLALLHYFPKDTGIIAPRALPAYAWETLRALGVEHRVRETTERHLVLERYFFSAPTAMTGCSNPYAIGFLRDLCLPLAEKEDSGTRKYYIRRVGKTRGIINEDEVAVQFRDAGWRIIDTEALTFAQQVALFSQAEAICGLHGAAFTNLLWCQPGCLAIELFASNFLNGCYENIARCLDLEHRYFVFDADASSFIHVDQDVVCEICRMADDHIAGKQKR